MRGTPWLTASLLLLGCAQGSGGTEPATAAAAQTASDGGSGVAAQGGGGGTAAPAPVACDGSIDAGAGTSISNTGACPGVLPAAPACATDIVLCSGVTAGADGALRGTFTSSAAIDGHGGVGLGCATSDVGPGAFVALFIPKVGGFVSKAPLGYQAWGTGTGFVGNAVANGPPAYDFLTHDGNALASVHGDAIFVGPRSTVVLRAGSQLTAQGYDDSGVALAAPQPVATLTAPASSLMFGGAAAIDGTTLVIWQVYGEQTASARWVHADGSAASEVFSVQGWLGNIPAAAALAGGGVAIPAQPVAGSQAQWRGVVAAGATVEQQAPQWLASRGAFHLLPGGTAMAFGAEIVSADGTLCGTVDLGAKLLGIGADGTAVTARDPKTFRVYPQLFGR